MAAHLKRRWCWRCASCSSLRRRDNSHTTHKGIALLDVLSIMFDRYSGQCDDMLANKRSDHESPG
ncbi:hypothetical protein T03_8579, partial [Trichinella britovi]